MDAMTSYSDPPFHCPPDPVVINLIMPPTTNTLFFNARGGHAGRIRTPEYNAWIKEAGWQLASQRPPQVLGRVSLLIEVQEPETKRRQDVANREKAVTDLLVSHRIIEGDDQRFVREITLRWAPVNGVLITIRPADQQAERYASQVIAVAVEREAS
jgi:Holliday junction resolvase RusA-like endonuclease